MSAKEQQRTILLLESFETYQGKGKIKIDLDLFPHLSGKNDNDINRWINDNFDNLYINIRKGELRPDRKGFEVDLAKKASLSLDKAVGRVLRRYNRPMKVIEILIGLEHDNYDWTGTKNPKGAFYDLIDKLKGVLKKEENKYIADPSYDFDRTDDEIENDYDIISLNAYWDTASLEWEKLKNTKKTLQLDLNP